jgi:predicted RNA-binding Zn ribbon-like protein
METHDTTAAGVERMRIVGGNLAIDFANTRVGPPGDPPDDDVLVTYDDLLAWSVHVGAMTHAEATALHRRADRDQAAASGALRRALALRDELDRVFRARAEGHQAPPRSVRALHEAEANALARASLHAGDGAFAWTWAGDRSLDRPIGPVVHAAIDLLTAGPLDRVKGCGGCSFLFLDESKNRSRRWCSMEDCGTDEKMRRFVARRAGRRLA